VQCRAGGSGILARTMDSWLIVGLGNPGPSYAGNRHNVGAMLVAELAARAGVGLRAHRARAGVGEARLGVLPGGAPGPKVVLATPLSYMNESGGPVAGLMRFFKIPLERLIVVHDELDIPFGSVRLKRGGGEGGHNGLRSISTSVGSKDYLRVRLGIGRPPGRMDAATFVLRDFAAAERKELPFLLADGVDAVDHLVALGLEAAQQRVHAPR
jgi:peptidyl-tRNA hydrolase, PTH1 family